jgi:hypothetical protein
MKTLKTGSEPVTPARANLARALERDHLEWRGDVVQAWLWTLMFAVAAVIVLVLLILATRAAAPPDSKQAGQTKRREPEEGMWLEVRDVLTTETAAVSTPDFCMPTPAAGLPEPLDRRKPRRLEPPERIDK